MQNFIYFSFLLFTPIVLCKEDLCPDVPVKIEFFKGLAPSTDLFGGKIVEDIFKGLVEGLASAFKKPENFSFPDNFNISDYRDDTQIQPLDVMGDEDGPHLPSASDIDYEPQPKEGSSGVVAKDQPEAVLPHPAKKIALPQFFKNVLPSVITDKNATNQLQEKLNAQSGTGASVLTGINFGNEDSDSSDQWGISLPANTLKAEIAKISGDSIRELTVIDSHTFRDSNKTTNDTSNFKRHVVLKDLDIKEKDLLIICLSMAIVKNDKQSTCQRCFLKQVCPPLDFQCCEKFLQFQAPESQARPQSVSLQYFVDQPPLKDMKFVAKLAAKPADSRCESANNNSYSMVEKSGILFPQTVTYLDINGLSPKYTYTIQVDLNVNFNDKNYRAPYKWSNPLVIQDYLESSEKPFVIPACSTGKK